MKSLIALVLITFLSACATGLPRTPAEDCPTECVEFLERMGIPPVPPSHVSDSFGNILLGAASAGIQITPDRLVTVKHSNWFKGNTLAVSDRIDARLVEHEGTPPKHILFDVHEGMRVFLYGSDIHGNVRWARGTVIAEKFYTCWGDYDPVIHVHDGPCTREGRGYVYGFGVRSEDGAGQGFSGGGIYTEDGALVGMFSMFEPIGLSDTLVFAYYIGDVMEEFELR